MKLASLMLVASIGFAAAAIACGHPPKGGGTTPTGGGGSDDGSGGATPGSGGGTGASAGSGGGAASGSAVSPDAPLAKDECVTMLGHIFDLGIAEKRKTWKPKDTPDADQLADYKAKMITANVQECMQTLPRDQYACAIKAATAADLEACPR
jgi:hypothetical protein